jgi:rod shape-determining protein MreD
VNVNASRSFLAGLLIVTAVLLQTAVVTLMRLPYGVPDLVLLAVVAVALAAGPGAGAAAGFAAGLLSDLLADHPAGLFALVLCLLGYAVGRFRGDAGIGVLTGLVVVGAATVLGELGYAAVLGVVDSARLDWQVVLHALPATVLYDVLLAPFLVSAVLGIDRHLVAQQP